MSKVILTTTSSFGQLDCAALDELRSDGWTIKLNPLGRRFTEDDAIKVFAEENVVGLIAGVEPLTRKVFEANPQLRFVSRCGTGTDSVDLLAAAEHDVVVLRTPDAPARAVAEFALGLILASIRRISEADRAARKGEHGPLMGSLLHQKTVGILGMGRIGSGLTALLAPFEVDVIFYDPIEISHSSARQVASLDELFEQSDVVSIHCALTDETRGLVTSAHLSLLGEAGILLNTARAGIVSDDDVLNALDQEILGYAAIDAFEDHGDPRIANLENLLVTNHMGSAAKETRQQMEREAAENLARSVREATTS